MNNNQKEPSRDSARTDLSFKILCSICDNELTANSDKCKFEYNSAYKATAKLFINPCSNCYNETMKPVKLLKQAMDLIK